MGFFNSLANEAGKKTGKAIGNALFGSYADDQRISDHLQKSVGKQKKLGKNSFESEDEKRYIADTTELISKCFDFCIETLGRSVG